MCSLNHAEFEGMLETRREPLALTKLIYRFRQSSYLLILFAISVIFCQFAYPDFLFKVAPTYQDGSKFLSLLIYDLYSCVLMFILPALFCRFMWSESLAENGLQFIKNYNSVFFIGFALTLLVPEILYFSHLETFRKIHSSNHVSNTQFFFTQFITLPAYYISEEFFFRGFLFLGLWKRVRWHSFWITDIVFTFAHLGKPGLEILMCIPASIVFNIITLGTRSIIPAFIVHCTLGILMNYLVRF